MSDTNETIADIIAEMRRRIAVKVSDAWYTQEEWRKLCDRLEAAIRREKAAVEADALAVGGIVGAAHRREMSKNTSKNGADFGQLGDCAKLREALVDIGSEAETSSEYRDYPIAGNPGERGYCKVVDADYLIEKCNAALAAPPRNCDVGTAEEQYKRFKKFCFDNIGDGIKESRCSKCPLYGTKSKCDFDWLQLHYEEGGNNGTL